ARRAALFPAAVHCASRAWILSFAPCRRAASVPRAAPPLATCPHARCPRCAFRGERQVRRSYHDRAALYGTSRADGESRSEPSSSLHLTRIAAPQEDGLWSPAAQESRMPSLRRSGSPSPLPQKSTDRSASRRTIRLRSRAWLLALPQRRWRCPTPPGAALATKPFAALPPTQRPGPCARETPLCAAPRNTTPRHKRQSVPAPIQSRQTH